MKKCLLLINKNSGNVYRALNNPDIYNALKNDYDIIDTLYIEQDIHIDIRKVSQGYAGLAVCGGDGTFNSAVNATRGLNLEITYIPCGTLNDTAKTLRLTSKLKTDQRKIRRVDIGEIGGTLFTYVAAAGTFTAIGYSARNRLKRKIKFLAYLWQVLKEYKVHHIKAKIKINDKVFDDTYTLIMAINSQRCFGFNFNHLYSHNSGKAHLLLIRSPKGKGLLSKIKIFFPFFRAFFIGFKKEHWGRVINFVEFSKAEIELGQKQDFTVDGEKITLEGKADIAIHHRRMKLYVY
ncbi:MAG TPA: hypothetical protein GXZ92_00285 [Clostridiales bacterium]|jgi:diacylglycerol kinase family enzyme|nr:hypothetical protein [Clostridiales bacterium]